MIKYNTRLKMDGIDLMRELSDNMIAATFVDFQYRGVLDKLGYGNEGARQKGRSQLQQMSNLSIKDFLKEIHRVSKSSAYIFMWVDKFHLCEGSHLYWIEDSKIDDKKLEIVDLITWNKKSFGMGYRTRRTSEYLLILQKPPKSTKSWKNRGIRDVWEEKIEHPRSVHPHKKPIGLIETLIASVVDNNETVLDPCSGSFVVLDACKNLNIRFVGCDLEG